MLHVKFINVYNMTKEILLSILELCEKEYLSEKDASIKILGKYVKLYRFKVKYGIQPNEQGKGPQNGKVKKYSLNDDFFSDKSLRSVYYAGFIAADGNISSKYPQLTIAVSSKDKEFLSNLQHDINSTYSIHEGIQRGEFPYCSICYTSDKICNDLKELYGIIPNKSLILNPPVNLSSKQKDCFIMGLIDGDGSIMLSKNADKQKRLVISCVGTIEMMSFVKARFEEILGESTSNLYVRNSEKNYCSYSIGDKKARIIFKYFMDNYPNIPAMYRKWSKEYLEYCNSYKKALPTCRRKGVFVFDLKGVLVKYCETLSEAEQLTGVKCGRISNLCKQDDSRHMSKGFMFSREKENMDPYVASESSNSIYKNLNNESKSN